MELILETLTLIATFCYASNNQSRTKIAGIGQNPECSNWRINVSEVALKKTGSLKYFKYSVSIPEIFLGQLACPIGMSRKIVVL